MKLSDQVIINLSTTNLMVAVGFVVVGLMILFYYVWTLNKKVRLLTPKYGFAGKKIVAVAMIAFLAGAAPMITLLALRSTEIRRQAKEEQTVVVTSQILERLDGGVIVGFAVIPMENGIAWGDKSYDVVWEVTGPTGFTFLEQEVNKQSPGYIVREVIPGEYEIQVRVIGEGFEIESTETKILE